MCLKTEDLQMKELDELVKLKPTTELIEQAIRIDTEVF